MAQEKILGNQLNLTDVAQGLIPLIPTDIVNDTTPQLGGNLDVNGYSITGGDYGTGTGVGGTLTITAGAGGTTGGNGGDFTLTAGSGTASSGEGGNINITAGAGGSAAAGGNISITGGASYTDAPFGNVTIKGGSGGNYGGEVKLIGGYNNHGFGDPGDVVIEGGRNSNASGQTGAARILGGVNLGDSSTGRGQITVAGAGTTRGGSVTIYAGAGGTLDAKDGGDVYLRAGKAGTGGTQAGGNILLEPGDENSGGTPGAILLGPSNSNNAAVDVRFVSASNYIALKAPNTVTTSRTWTLPQGSPVAGHVLHTNGSGSLYFAAATGGVTNPMSADLDVDRYAIITADTTALAQSVDPVTITGGNNTYDNFKNGGNQTIEYAAGNIVITAGDAGTAYSSDGKAYGAYGVNGGQGSPYVGVGSPNFPAWGNAPGVIRIKGGSGNRSEYFSYNGGNVEILGGDNSHAYWTGYGGQINIEGGQGYYGGSVFVFGGQANQSGVGKHGSAFLDGGFSYANTPSGDHAAGDVYIRGGGTESSGACGRVNVYGGSKRPAATNTARASDVYIRGGNDFSTTNGVGPGHVSIAGGGGFFPAADGGDVYIEPGRKQTGANDGKVVIHTSGGNTDISNASLHLSNTTNNGFTLSSRTYVTTELRVDPTLAADNVFALPANDGNTGDVLTMTAGSPPTSAWQSPRMPIYTVATLPPVVEGGMIYVSDATTGVGSPKTDTGVQCFGRGSGSPARWIDVITGLEVA